MMIAIEWKIKKRKEKALEIQRMSTAEWHYKRMNQLSETKCTPLNQINFIINRKRKSPIKR